MNCIVLQQKNSHILLISPFIVHFSFSLAYLIRCLVTKHYDWFALVNKYLTGKIKRTSMTLTEILPISDRFIKQKYYCITVHFRTVCASENHLGQIGQQTLGHLELLLDYV